jgi:hypothetical protein
MRLRPAERAAASETNGADHRIFTKDPGASERDLARKLRQQICEWKMNMMRAPLRTRTAAGVPVERRSRRRPALEGLSA